MIGLDIRYFEVLFNKEKERLSNWIGLFLLRFFFWLISIGRRTCICQLEQQMYLALIGF